jgi:hypothetical protein
MLPAEPTFAEQESPSGLGALLTACIAREIPGIAKIASHILTILRSNPV